MRKTLIILLSIISFISPNFSQVCDGNLGDNIFAIGDFGFGEDNNILIDPGIAPGYIYTTSGPPSDGYYTISNNMGLWPNLYSTWLPIGDRSNNPNGYMMVVNASFEPGVFYEEDIDGLCENTLYEFSADVINLIRSGVDGHITPNVSFLLNGNIMYTSGSIAQDEQWHKYGFTFITQPGQTTVTLTLRNNAPGGIGNDLALDNISFRPCGPDAFANADKEFLLCSNDLDPVQITAETTTGSAIQWQFYNNSTETWEFLDGETEMSVFHNIFDPGVYLYRYLSAGSVENLANEKCRVISDTASVTVQPVEFSYFDTICQNVDYIFGSQTLNTEGFYEETFLASTGCDSFVDLFLTIVPEVDLNFDLTITDPSCFGYEDGFIEINNVSGGTLPYSFILNQSQTETGGYYDLSSGNYTVRILDRYSCGEDLNFTLENPELFTIEIGQDTAINLGETFVFPIENNYDIVNPIWSGEELSCFQCLENSARPLFEGQYALYGESQFGCIASDSIFISITELEDQFFKPNIFSPNEDGINDEFIIYTNSPAVEEVEDFVIADRWGNIVFEKKNLAFGDSGLFWNGYTAGNKSASGVYSYFMKLSLINGEYLFIKGDVTLIR